MDNLRLILIIAGIFILAGIYFWDSIQSKRKMRRQRINSATDVGKNPEFVISGNTDTDEDIASELAELNDFIAGSKSGAEDDMEPETIIITRDSSVQTGTGWGRDAGAEIPDLFSQPQEPEETIEDVADTSADSNDEAINPDSVISLYVMAPEGARFSGDDIYTALTSLGFKFGEMNIFHHHGIGQLKSDQALFSLVNMYEPGYFTIDTIDELSTRGLSIFMCLPTSHSSEVVFAYMLEIARRLASKLNATVYGPDRKEITQKTLDSIAIQIKKYEH